MDPITLAISLGLMGVGGLTKGISNWVGGARDRKEAEGIREEIGDRPKYEIPESVKGMTSLAEQMYKSGMPGYDTERGDIQAATARTAGTAAQLADSPVGALTALGAAESRELGALRDLGTRAARYQQQMGLNYQNALGQQAQYENLQWDWNQGRRWQEGMNRADAYEQSGRQRSAQGWDALGSMFGQAGSAVGMFGMYGGGGAPGTPPTQMTGMSAPNYNLNNPSFMYSMQNYLNEIYQPK